MMLELETPPTPAKRVGRTGKELLRATTPFAQENRARSWWCLLSTVTLMTAALVAAGMAPWWPLQLVLAPIAGMLMVRAFIHFHDFMHGAILQGSWLAEAIFFGIGVLVLTPPRSWRHSHNYHHAHVGQLEASSVGSFPIMTTEAWSKATPAQRLRYRVARSPVTLACAYATVFFWSITVDSFLKEPKRYWDSLAVVGLHAGLITTIALIGGANPVFFGLLLPMFCAAVAGAYLFYAQHNFVGVRILPSDEWTYDHAALESSSFLKLGPLMHWFTGNIGYHHVHHLNPAVPFYRLPEAMRGVSELQNPPTTSLRVGDIIACLRLKLWDPKNRRMISFREAKLAA